MSSAETMLPPLHKSITVPVPAARAFEFYTA
jgi:hypothetical protein